jgi:ABC-type Fe3+-citrate transport system substrate-binding protein
VRRLEVDLRELRDEHQATAGKEESMNDAMKEHARQIADEIEQLSKEMYINIQPTRDQCFRLERLALQLRGIIEHD